MPKSPRTFERSMSLALMAMTISASSFMDCNMEIFVSGLKPGSTREAW